MVRVALRVAVVMVGGLAVGCGGHSGGGATGPFSTGAGVQSGASTAGTSTSPSPSPSPSASASPSPSPSTSPSASPSPSPSPTRGQTYQVATWVPYWTYGVADGLLAANVGIAIDEVNLFGYSLQADGSLVAKRGVEDAARIATIRGRGGKLVSTVFDVEVAGALDAVLADPARRQRAVDAVLDAIDRNGLDGIDLDFEHATSTTRDAFTRFVQQIGTAVRARNKLFSVTVPPKKADRPNWAGYDYPALGAAADRVKIMGYGVHGSWSAAGPLGPVDWLGDVVTYAKATIGARKLQVGIPLYGYDWDQGGGTRAVITWADLQTKLRQAGGAARYDAASAESTFDYTDAQGVRHTVWFTEPRGVARKAELVRSEGLLGMSLWAVGYGEQAHLDRLRAALGR